MRCESLNVVKLDKVNKIVKASLARHYASERTFMTQDLQVATTVLTHQTNLAILLFLTKTCNNAVAPSIQKTIIHVKGYYKVIVAQVIGL